MKNLKETFIQFKNVGSFRLAITKGKTFAKPYFRSFSK